MALSYPRFPGVMQARAWIDKEGNPRLDIEPKEMARLEALLKEKFGRNATMRELFDYVKEAQTQ